ncbi:MAG: hypothetical protein QNJ34_01805 [Xenococcaceae cyanobacterium MO_188.B29]|nr:hypothetical protein [Xenococcaceae cyanobacterium MO_188.B29]
MKLKNLGIALATTGCLLSVSQTTHAQSALRNDGIQFTQDTIVEFEFIESHGAYQSAFGVVDLDSCQSSYGNVDLSTCERIPLLVEEKASDFPESVVRRSTYEDNENQTQDFLGTPGNAVPHPMAEFMFKAGKRYAFYLESSFNGVPAGIKYSSAIYNPRDSQQAIFVDNLTPDILQARRRNTPDINLDPQLEQELGQLVNGGIVIRWDDTGSVLVPQAKQDTDFDDFIIGVGGELDCY